MLNRKEPEEKTHQIVVYLRVVGQCMWYLGRDLGGILQWQQQINKW